MGHIRDCVQEFHEAFGHLVSNEPAIPSDNIVYLRMRLIREEVEETIHAIEKGNAVGMVDGVCDVLYVVAGTAVCFGLPLNEPEITTDGSSEFPTSSMSYALSSAEYIASGVLRNFTRSDVDHNDYVSLKAALDLLTFVSIQITSALGLDVKELFDEVHRSNMQKLGSDGKPIYREDRKIMKPEGWEPPNLLPIIERQLSAIRS